MASQQQEQLTSKQQVLRELEVARASLGRHVTLAVKEWNPRTMLSHSLERHRTLWMGGAAVAGLFLVRFIFSSGRSNYGRDNLGGAAKNRGLMALLLTPLLAYGRKAALSYGAQMFQSYLQRKVSPNASPADRV